MDDQIIETINDTMEAINRDLEELKWQKYLMMLPEFLEGQGDTRGSILLYLSYLLADTCDYNWGGITPIEMAEFLRDISDAILNITAAS